MYLIGLTGGIASGKSTVARRLVEHGAIHIDADALAREAVEPGSSALGEIAEAFGPEMLRADGTLDRVRLGDRVFGDDDALARLNAIVHPHVRELFAKHAAEAERIDPDAVVVYDVPLLVEASVDHPFDLVVVTEAPASTRVGRLVDERGLERGHAQARVDAQASDAERREVADVVIDTGGTLAHTMGQVDALWAGLRERRSSA
ncbi:dephospho-CoA kinase [Agromyces rhizosphaerae]|uniref:Dephospho-CoA kinase n=1 Tax=Agromyces rhizosphaerae TaxID=88374 RepID=A0A9W6CZI1_9MICO|nr:dephospho-CoA kinase [Agromyces rhizosphaerae]GLI28836.1 dephospho-CoA kinase [Agromyces rhizosphaerae]